MAPIVHVDMKFPGSQVVALVVRNVPGLESVKLNEIDIAALDAMKPEYIEKFPLHLVPGLEDDGFYMMESHAICPYLISAYATDDKLYPKNDLKKRAKIDEWLHFCNSLIYVRLRAMSEPLWRQRTNKIPDDKKEFAKAAFRDFETMLGENKFLCGNELTLADIAGVCPIHMAPVLVGDISEFKKISAWLKRCQTEIKNFDEIVLPGYQRYKGAVEYFTSQP